MNKKTQEGAERKPAALGARHEEIARRLHDAMDTKRPKVELSYNGRVTVRRMVTKLANVAGVRRLKSHSATFRRAMLEIYGKAEWKGWKRLRGKECVESLARWLGVTAPPEDEPATEAARLPLPPLKKHKTLRRIPVRVITFEVYGIERGDTALVAMTGEVRPGELGFFQVRRYSYTYDVFAFVCACDKACHASTDKSGGVCLRYDPKKCEAHHEGTPYGRVVAVERKRRPVETTLELRPFDEREGGPVTRWNAGGESRRVEATTQPLETKKGRGGETVNVVTPEGREGHTTGITTLVDDALADFGYLRGDTLLVDYSVEPAEGALACVERKDGRVHLGGFRETRTHVILAVEGYEDEEVEKSEVASVGVVAGHARVVDEHELEWPTIITPRATPEKRELTPEQKREIERLRDRLRRLDEEDDQILRCTERFRIEKLIYDIEHGTEGGDR